jgi:hypothetical protein
MASRWGRGVEGDPEQASGRNEDQAADDNDDRRERRNAEERSPTTAPRHEVAENGNERIEEGVEVTGPPARPGGRATLWWVAHVGGAWPRPWTFAQVSLRVSVRLKTSAGGTESGSGAK